MVIDDLYWKEELLLYIFLSLGTLNILSDAGNLIDVQHVAQLVLNSLECRCRLHEHSQSNPYEALLLGNVSGNDESANNGN